MARRGVAIFLIAGVSLALAGSAQATSSTQRQIEGLFWAITWFALAVAAIVFGALIYFLWRYRESVSPPRPGESKAHAEGHRKVEAVWTIFPIVILVLITALSLPVLWASDGMPPADLTIHVTGERFSWTFEYEEPGVPRANWTKTIGEAWFQTGIVVHFKVTSRDVIHSFALPQLRVKIDAINGTINTAWTRVDIAGDYLDQCAEFCGVGHYGMRATIHVFEPQPGRRPYGPPPTSLPFTNVELNGFGAPPWNIEPRRIEATDEEVLRLRIWNNNSQDYTFRIDPPVDLQVPVPAFGVAWLNVTIDVTSDEEVPYGPTDPDARRYGMNGTLNVTIAKVIELREYSVSPSPLNVTTGPVKFLLRNLGSQAHNFTMGGVYANVRWDPLIAPGQSVVIGPFDLDQNASGQYWCGIPGHRDLGMEAPYQVGAGGDLGQAEVLPLFDMTAITFAIGVPVTLAYVIRHARRRDE